MRARSKRGFTIVELTVTIAVIGILSIILIPTASGVKKESKRTAALAEARESYVQFLRDHAEDESFRVPDYVKVNGAYFPIENGKVAHATEDIPTDVRDTDCAKHENCDGIQFETAVADEIEAGRGRSEAEAIYASFAKSHKPSGGIYIAAGERFYEIDFLSGAATPLEADEAAGMHFVAIACATHENCKSVFRSVAVEE